MAKKYTFTVTATLCKKYEDITRMSALCDLEGWLKELENDSDLPGCSPFEKIEIV